MKKVLIVALLCGFLSILCLLFSCVDNRGDSSAIESSEITLQDNDVSTVSEESKSSETSISEISIGDISADESQTVYELGLDDKHLSYYSNITFDFIDGLTRDDYIRFGELFYRTFSFNYGDLCDYYCIPKETFGDACREMIKHIEEYDLFDYPYEKTILESVDAWYADLDSTAVYEKYSDVPMQLVHEDQSVFLYDNYEFPEYPTAFARDKNDANKYTNRYYTIDSALIGFVGVKQFSDYYEKYAYTADFNIISFIDYFEISKEEYVKLYQELYEKHYKDEEGEVWICIYPYNPDYLFGTEEMQSEYFCRHDRTQK